MSQMNSQKEGMRQGGKKKGRESYASIILTTGHVELTAFLGRLSRNQT